MRHLPLKNSISGHLVHLVISANSCCLEEYSLGRKKVPIIYGYGILRKIADHAYFAPCLWIMNHHTRVSQSGLDLWKLLRHLPEMVGERLEWQRTWKLQSPLLKLTGVGPYTSHRLRNNWRMEVRGLESRGFHCLGKEDERRHRTGGSWQLRQLSSHLLQPVLQLSGRGQEGQGGKWHISEPKDNSLSG